MGATLKLLRIIQTRTPGVQHACQDLFTHTGPKRRDGAGEPKSLEPESLCALNWLRNVRDLIVIFRLTKRAKLLCVFGSLILVLSAAVLWLLAFYEPQGHQPAFRLDVVREMKNAATNVVVFRLVSLDGKHNYSLLTPGTISTPLPRTGFAPSVVFLEAHYSVYGRWTLMSLPPATWATNFVTVAFKNQIEFAIVAPTNDVWRLNMQICRVLSRTEAFTWKTERAWGLLKSRKFSAVPGAWFGPWSVTFNYLTWSAPFTNRPSLDNQTTRAVP
jgi:hypothetical protein